MRPQITRTPLDGLIIIDPICFSDSRGAFYETWHMQHYADVGLDVAIIQTSHSISNKDVLRGLHYQTPYAPMGKLVRCSRGAIFDVAVDLRRDSKTLGAWYGLVLGEENMRQLWIPVGFAHGFLTLSDAADVQYQQTGAYEPSSERAIAWDDPDLDIAWDVSKPVLSEKDRSGMSFADYLENPDFT